MSLVADAELTRLNRPVLTPCARCRAGCQIIHRAVHQDRRVKAEDGQLVLRCGGCRILWAPRKEAGPPWSAGCSAKRSAVVSNQAGALDAGFTERIASSSL